MRAYITVLESDYLLVPYFVRHYSRLGATEFPILAYSNEGKQAEDMDTVCRLVEEAGGKPLPVVAFHQKVFSAYRRDQLIHAIHPKNQWAFFADLDEFAQLTPEKVQQYISQDVVYVAGRWLDRLAPGGKLVDIDPSKTLEEQYPMGCHFRQKMGAGDSVFVLSKVAPNLHHPYSCKWGREYFPNRVPVITSHHFKWQGNVLRRLKNRLRRINAKGKHGSGWWKNVKATVNHLERHKGINPAWLRTVGPVLGI